MSLTIFTSVTANSFFFAPLLAAQVLERYDPAFMPCCSCASLSEVGWTSGLVVRDEEAAALFAARGLELVRSPTLLLGLHNSSGTLNVLAPKVCGGPA
jgi:hypothetical protein